MTARRRRGSDGVTIVEAAFALPILLTFIFGLIDIGMWTFNANQATNAARDGARLGIIDFEDADDESSDMHEAIVAAVGSRLEEAKVESVDVSCVSDTGATKPCSSATVDVDSIKVEVEWAWDLITPVAAILGYDRGEATGSASMRLVGRPLASTAGSTTTTSSTSSTTSTTTTTTTPSGPTTTTTTSTPAPACAVTLLTLEEPSGGVKRAKSKGAFTGQLETPIPVSFATNGSASCSDLRVQVQSTDGKLVNVACGCDYEPPKAAEYRWSYDGSDNIWFAAGDAYMRVFNGTTPIAQAKFNVK